MDEIFAECAQNSSVSDTGRIGEYGHSACSAECFPVTEVSMGTLQGLGVSTRPAISQRETVGIGIGRGGEQMSVGRMAELAKRIETSAGVSTAWGRFAGQELSRLRTHFGQLLQAAFQNLGYDSAELLRQCNSGEVESSNRDLVLCYRLACLLAASLRDEQAQDIFRIEIGCSSGKTEFACFIAEKSVGVTVHRNDNLFALCTNGGWQIGPDDKAPEFSSLRCAIELFGGKVRLEGVRTMCVKVSFPIPS